MGSLPGLCLSIFYIDSPSMQLQRSSAIRFTSWSMGYIIALRRCVTRRARQEQALVPWLPGHRVLYSAFLPLPPIPKDPLRLVLPPQVPFLVLLLLISVVTPIGHAAGVQPEAQWCWLGVFGIGYTLYDCLHWVREVGKGSCSQHYYILPLATRPLTPHSLAPNSCPPPRPSPFRRYTTPNFIPYNDYGDTIGFIMPWSLLISEL